MTVCRRAVNRCGTLFEQLLLSRRWRNIRFRSHETITSRVNRASSIIAVQAEQAALASMSVPEITEKSRSGSESIRIVGSGGHGVERRGRGTESMAGILPTALNGAAWWRGVGSKGVKLLLTGRVRHRSTSVTKRLEFRMAVHLGNQSGRSKGTEEGLGGFVVRRGYAPQVECVIVGGGSNSANGQAL